MIVLERLTAVGFMINLAKCDFLESEVEVLGNILGNGLIKPCYKQLQVIAECKEPKSVRNF